MTFCWTSLVSSIHFSHNVRNLSKKKKKKFLRSHFFLKENQRINSCEERRNLLGSCICVSSACESDLGGQDYHKEPHEGPRLTWETKEYRDTPPPPGLPVALNTNVASSFLWSSRQFLFFFFIIAGIFIQHGGLFFKKGPPLHNDPSWEWKAREQAANEDPLLPTASTFAELWVKFYINFFVQLGGCQRDTPAYCKPFG